VCSQVIEGFDAAERISDLLDGVHREIKRALTRRWLVLFAPPIPVSNRDLAVEIRHDESRALDAVDTRMLVDDEVSTDHRLVRERVGLTPSETIEQ